GLAAKPQDWQWSSVHHHLRGTVDPLVKEDCLPRMAGIPWSEFLSVDTDHKDQALFQKHERTGRPCGDSLFVDQLENLLGRKLKPQKPGPKVKN
ncbi:MAG: transposase, partial [Desulfobacterales bacterium]